MVLSFDCYIPLLYYYKKKIKKTNKYTRTEILFHSRENKNQVKNIKPQILKSLL